MRKFSFSFDKLIVKKKQEMEEAQREMAPLVAKYNYFKQNQRESLAFLKELKDDFSKSGVGFYDNLHQQKTTSKILARLESILSETSKELLPWQKLMQKKNAEKKALEIIREKKYQEWKKLKAKQENNLLEEMFIRYQ